MPASEQERLLLTEPAQSAFITAEMRSFLTLALERNDSPSGNLTRWEMSIKDKINCNLMDEETNKIINDEYSNAIQTFQSKEGGQQAIDLLCNVTQSTFKDGFELGLLSALGSAICYFRDAYRSPTNLAACERIGLSDYAVAHHITDMYHHRNFRGAYTKTLTPSGDGDVAARIAVGLEEPKVDVNNKRSSNNSIEDTDADVIIDEHEDDECIQWSPTNPDNCIHWKSDNEAWRKKRFERIQMEGTKDPRRGGSGTSR